MNTITIKTEADIPAEWTRLYAQKKTTVAIRACKPGGETFRVSWSDSILHANPEEDVVIVQPDGREYPCKKDIFIKSYQAIPALSADSFLAGYQFLKKAKSILVEIPQDTRVTIHTLEGVVKDVEYPDYIVIGVDGELYCNTKKYVDQHMRVLKFTD